MVANPALLFGDPPKLPYETQGDEVDADNSVPPAHMDLSEESHALQQNYIRFQKTLLSSVDRQVARISEKLNENDILIRRTEDEKNHLGVNLYEARVEIGKMNGNLAHTREYVDKLENELKVVESERDAGDRSIAQLTAQNRNLQTELDTLRKKLDESDIKAANLTDINTAYHSNIKIHRRIEGKIKKELEYIDERRRQAEADLEDQRKLNEKLIQDKKELELILTAQKHETNMANQSIAKMNDEINMLESQKKDIQKHWEDSLTAMSKRDEAFEAVNDQKDIAREKLFDSDNMNRVLRMEKEEQEKKLKEKELECQGLESQVQFLRSSLSVLEHKHKDTRGALVEAQVAESLYKQELKRVSKHHELAKDELERKTISLSEMKGRLDHLKFDFEEKIRNETIMQVAKKEELVRAFAEAEIKHIRRDEEGKNTDLRHENAELRMQLLQSEDKLRIITEERDRIQKIYDDVNNHYMRLYDEAKHLMYDLERKEHDINYLKATVQELNEVDKTRPYQMAVAKLQKELGNAKSEIDNIQTMWLESQKENLKCKNEIGRLSMDNTFLRTQLGITDTVKIKTAKEIEESKQRDFEQKMETAKLYSELRKIQPLVEEYRDKILTLEQQLVEAKTHLQKEHVNTHTSTNMLKTEIRRLHQDRRETSKARITDERTNQTLERKYILSKEMIDKLKSERTELQKNCFELKRRAEEMEKRWYDGQEMARKMAEKAGRTVGEITLRLSNGSMKQPTSTTSTPLYETDGLTLPNNQQNQQQQQQNQALINLLPIKLPPPVWASFATTPDSGTRAPSEPAPSEVQSGELSLPPAEPIVRAQTNEMPELSNKLLKLEKSLNEVQSRMKLNERELKSFQQIAKLANAKYSRAEKVAAVIERQFKEAKPNTRINYAVISDVEPSTQLIAALMLRESEILDPKTEVKQLPLLPHRNSLTPIQNRSRN
ncbi:Coiled-coil domain-containing protein 40, partial [Blyttiomyces sp. JEL0837]